MLSCFEDIEVLYQDDVGKCDDESILKCVAFKWINLDKPVIANSPALLNGNEYSYSVHQYKSYGFIHPNSKAACFVTRRDGSLDFYYQGTGMEFKKVSIQLDGPAQWISQASIGFLREGAVIVATYSAIDQSLKVYKLVVDWNMKNCVPAFKVEKLVMERLNKVGANGYPMQLDRIDVISPNFSLETNLGILISFTGLGCGGLGRTLLQKYHITTEFKNLRFKSDMGNVEGYPSLVLIAEDTMDNEILDIGFKNFDFFIMVVATDGHIQLRTRKKLQLHIPSSSSVSSLLDTGYYFPMPNDRPDALCICPSLSGYVTLMGDVLQFYPVKKQTKQWEQKDVSMLSAGIAYLFSSACYTSTIADELIAVIQNELMTMDDKTRYDFIIKTLQEGHKALNFNLDISKEQIDRLLVNPPMQRLLSLQYSLGKFLPTNEQSCIALAILNLRLISFSIMVTLRTLFHQQQRIAKKGNQESLIDSIYRSESVLSTVGTINYLMEFVVFTIQEMIQVSQDPSYKTIVVSLFFSTIPRSFLSYSIAGVKKIDSVLMKVMEQHMQQPGQSTLNTEILHKSCGRFKSLLKLVDLDNFEKFLMQVEQMGNIDKTSSKLVIEQSLVFGNKVAESQTSLTSQLIAKFQQHFDGQPLSEIYFHDTRWLKLTVEPNALPSKVLLTADDPVPIVLDLNSDLIDDVTKMRTTNKEKLKRCLRCEYIRGDNDDVFHIMGKGLTGTTNHWPVAYNRTCLCGSCWVYLSGDECAV
jgi:mediator of RNA polymerase II transcription subunit 16